VIGDELDNIELSRDTAGTIRVNAGAVLSSWWNAHRH
jgi:hypothetical protein